MENIVNTFDDATPEEKRQGKTWYKEAHDYCVALSKEFGIDLRIVIGIMAALSPRREWTLNKRQTRFYLEGKRNLHTRIQMSKCNRIYAGSDIELVLGGLKTINFYRNILNPKDFDPCTIDLWMLRLYPSVISLTPKKYESIKKDFNEVAKLKGTITNRVQATCWISMRNAKH